MRWLVEKCKASEVFSWAIAGLGIGLMILIALI